MQHKDHVALIQQAINPNGGTWADIGSGTGAFTLALADLLGDTGRIISVDRDRHALAQQQRTMRQQFPATAVEYRVADFTEGFQLEPVDGILMANSLHFVTNKLAVLRNLRWFLNHNAPFILVEYNTDRGNPWVPYPLSFSTWERLAREAGFSNTTLLATVPSRFLGEIFSAASY